jgi:cell division protein FtsI (penicillin-binding protein 3)
MVCCGPVFKELHKRFLQMFLRQTKKNINRKVPKQEKNYNNYFELQKNSNSQFLMLRDARNGCDCFLENLGVKVKAVGMGRVKTQSFKRVRI